MSCSSPFDYSTTAGVTVTVTSNVGVKGSYTLPGYTIPSTQLCWLQWKAPYTETGENCKKNKAWGIKSCKWSWVKGSSKWCCCETIGAIPIWPAITFTGSVTIPFTITASTGVTLSVDAPPTPYQATAITLEACKCSLGINGSTISINILPEALTVQESDGEFSVDIELYGFSSSETIAGITYSLTVDSSLLLCLDPVPPVGWINLLLSCTLSAFEKGIVNYSVNFAISLPIVSVED
jgi:hypothetical protein